MQQKTGIAATLSIIMALLSFFATFTGHVIIGFMAALASVPLGIMGLFMAASPRVGGGILSIVAIALGAFGLLAAFLGLIGIVLF